MNIFNGGCWTRYCRIPFWTSPYSKDRITLASLNNVRKLPCQTNPAKLFVKSQCLINHHVLASLFSRTQVRFNNNCPQLHRDYQFPNFDAYRKDQYKDVRKTDWGAGEDKPGYTYFIGFFGFLCGAYISKAEVIHYVMFMDAPADVLALASVEIEIGKIEPGVCLSLKWRGKPLFIKHRTQVDIDNEANTPMSALRDPETPEQRTTRPEWLIVIGICTHLGCVPIPNSGDWPGGFYCPCHGSHYDNIGRTRKGPAPTNLEIPQYKFLSDTLVLVG